MLLFRIFIPLLILPFSCQKDSQLNELFEFPRNIKEASALEIAAHSDLLWAIQDRNNTPEIFGFDKTGQLQKTIFIKNAQNIDWEDLTSDEKGNLYIGDFGNNDNLRKDLAIYVIDKNDLIQKEANASTKISFFYPEQTSFPPKKSNRIYDAEAFFFWKENFYIFTKNRSISFDGTFEIYKVPNKPGNHAAQKIGSYTTCDSFKNCAITSADISIDGTKVVLLSSSKIWLITDFRNDDFLNGSIKEIPLNHYSQKEGICFNNNSSLYISDERSKKNHGKVYEFQL